MSTRAIVPALLLCLATLLPARAGADDYPANGWVVWESNRADSRREIYLAKADGSGVTRLTTTGGRLARWSPDGRWIAYRSLVDESAHVMRWDKSEDKRLFDGQPLFWLHDNSGLVCRLYEDFYLVDPETGSKTLMFKHGDFTAVADKQMDPGGITADGRWMIAGSDRYRDGHDGANGSFKAGFAAILLDLKAKEKVYFVGSGCGPSTPPTSSLVFHVCGEAALCPTYPDVYTLDVNDLATRSSYKPEMNHPNDDWGHEYMPYPSTDGKWLAYAASTGCHDQEFCDYEIWLHPLGAGIDKRYRVTNDAKNDQYPALYVGELWQPAKSPSLLLNPSLLSFEAKPGETPAEQKIAVKNAGGGTLDALSVQLTYAAGSGWLTAKVSGSGNEQQVTVSVKTDGLAAGTYQGTVQLSAANATNSPANAAVTLKLTTPPTSKDAGGPDAATPPASSGGGCALSGGGRVPGAGALLEAGAGALLLGLLVLGLRARRRPR